MNFRTLNADEIECRVAMCKPNGAQLLLYKDARCDMNILDETVGAANWQRKHEEHHGNLFCSVGINVNYTDPLAYERWIWKEDAGAESNTEAEKGHASDSFKRACVNWGIGRELYTSPFIWIKGVTEKNDKGKWECKVRFKVSAIEYDDKRRICALVITDSNGEVMYQMGSKRMSKALRSAVAETGEKNDPGYPEPKPAPQNKDAVTMICADCGETVRSYLDGNGKLVSHTRLTNATIESFGRPLCRDCAAKAADNV